MRAPQVVFLLTAFLVLCLGTGCSRQNRLDILKYKNRLLEERSKKDKFFKFSEHSPIAATKRWQFNELSYFPPDPSYQVRASYTPFPSQEELTIPTSSGQGRVYVKVGEFKFDISEKRVQLVAYMEKAWLGEDAQHSLFVPFTDLTTGVSTYGAGRYLDIQIPDDNNGVIDFNLAYNPYCAYNNDFSCPLVPSENALSVSINAGEKKFKNIDN